MPTAEQLAAEPTMTVTVRDIHAEAPWGSGMTDPVTRKITISALCPTCGGPRGEPKGLNQCEDGAHWWTQVWANPCGHPDMYVDVIAEWKRYVELDPAGPQPAGDVGGDYQCGEAWGRRFARRIEGTVPWAVIEVTFHIEDGAVVDFIDGAELTRITSYSTCTDIRDVGATEGWAGTKHERVPTAQEPTEQDVKQACHDLDPAGLAWDGTPF